MVSSATWLDAQHRQEAIAHRPPQQTALHAVADMVVAMVAATDRRTRLLPRPTRRRRPGAAAAAARRAV
jgi:hypothetical protein